MHEKINTKEEKEAVNRYRIDAQDKMILQLITNFPSMKKSEVARELGISLETLMYRMRRPAFKKALEKVNETVYDILQQSQRDAAKKLQKLLDSKNERVALDAAKAILSPILNPSNQSANEQPAEIIFATEIGDGGQIQQDKITSGDKD